MTTQFKRFSILMTLITTFLVGCGGGSNDQQLPAAAQLSVSPVDINWEITPNRDADSNCIIDIDFYNDQRVQVRLTSAEGAPIGDVDVEIVASLSDNTFSGFPFVEIYQDINSNGVAEDDELVSDSESPAFKTRLDRFNGTADFIVRTNLSCPYRSSVSAFASNTFASMDITVIDTEG